MIHGVGGPGRDERSGATGPEPGAGRPTVVVVPTGVANMASVAAAFHRLGVATQVSDAPDRVADAPAVVLPGVGAFASARGALARSGSAHALVDRIQRRAPTLAICLGMQLLCEGSTEARGEAGLGVVPGVVDRFTDTRWIPQLGWNSVEPTDETGLVRGGHAYFAHSYRLTDAPPGWSVSWAESGAPFVAAFEDQAVLACQFHPELSGTWGSNLLRRWAVRAGVLSC